MNEREMVERDKKLLAHVKGAELSQNLSANSTRRNRRLDVTLGGQEWLVAEDGKAK